MPEDELNRKMDLIREMAEELPFYLNMVGVRCITLEQCMGIEIPNEKRPVVPLRNLLLSHDFRESKAELPVAIGYTQTQMPKVIDPARAPHILVAGATKQGKSVWMNTVIASLLFSKSPSEVKFVFIDPKMVEFETYKKLSHHYLAVLLNPSGKEEETIDIAKSQMDSAHVLESLCFEMDKRYGFMSGSMFSLKSLTNCHFLAFLFRNFAAETKDNDGKELLRPLHLADRDDQPPRVHHLQGHQPQVGFQLDEYEGRG